VSSPFDLVAQASALLEAVYHRNRISARLWAKARSRYLRRIARLPVPHPRPAWWTATDEAARDPAIEAGGWCCRTCVLWRSPDGRLGVCAMPETPATVNCGETRAASLCEQWTAWPKAEGRRQKAEQEVMEL
jgi:hypothetical protein